MFNPSPPSFLAGGSYTLSKLSQHTMLLRQVLGHELAPASLEKPGFSRASARRAAFCPKQLSPPPFSAAT
jgi:hypothetical protein